LQAGREETIIVTIIIIMIIIIITILLRAVSAGMQTAPGSGKLPGPGTPRQQADE